MGSEEKEKVESCEKRGKGEMKDWKMERRREENKKRK